jgi:hypothetical protein
MVVWQMALPGGPVAGKPMAVLEDAGAYGAFFLDRPMEDLPCSVRHCIGLSLGLHIVSTPEPS